VDLYQAERYTPSCSIHISEMPSMWFAYIITHYVNNISDTDLLLQITIYFPIMKAKTLAL